MKQTNRILSLLLCFIMVVSLATPAVLAVEETTVATVPSGIATEGAEAQAAGETIYVLAGGDFQEAGDHSASAENVTNILSTIKKQYPTMDGFLFIGDYDCESHGDSTETTSGIAKLMETVQASYSNINHDNSILAQGNHDATNQYIDGSTTGTYGYDLDGYAAFVLNEDQYPNYGGTSSGVQSLANELKAWLEDKVVAKYDKPIFIVSHLPLAFNPRTNVQGDGMYAKYIFDVLNDKAAEGLNIFFLHGHNHAYGYDEYLGGHAIYLAKGDNINIAVAGSKTSYTTETLNFTYMNAGYTGYYNESGYTTSNAGTDKLSMTVFAITDSDVTVGRYSANGALELKTAGEMKGDYINNVSVTANTATYATTQTIALTQVTGDNSNNGGNTDAGTSNGWIEIPAASAGYQYVLDTDGIDYGSNNQYIIVARDAAKVLNATSTSGGTVENATITGNTAIVDTRDYEYYFTTGNLVTRDGSNTLYQQNWVIRYGNLSGSNLNGFTNYGDGYYRIYDTDGTARSLYYDGSAFNVTSENHTDQQYSIRLYKYSGEISGGDACWASIDGPLSFDFAAGTSQATVEAQIKEVITGYTSASSDGSNASELKDSELSWSWDGGFQSEGSSTMTVSYNGVKLGSVDVHIAVAPGEGVLNGWVPVQEAGTTYKYVLDTNGVDTGVEYLIVAESYPKAFSAASSSNNAVDITIDGNYAYADSDTYGWTFTKYGSSNTTYYVRLNGSTYLTLNNGTIGSSTSTGTSRRMTVTNQNDGEYSIVRNGYYLRWSNSNGVFQSSSSNTNNVRLYKYDGTVTTSALYASLEGTTEYTVVAGTMTKAQIEAKIKAGLTGYTASDANGTNKTALDDSALTWSWDKTVSPSTEGNYTMTVSYKGKTLGTVNVCIQEKQIARVDLPAEGWIDQYATKYAAVTTEDGEPLYATVVYEDGTEVEVPVKLNMLSQNGSSISTKISGDFSGLTLAYDPQYLRKDFTLHINEVWVNNYPEYPDEGAVNVNKTGTGIDFQSSGLAQIELSASGVPIKKGADVIVMLDTSSSMDDHVDENYDGVRADDEPMRFEVLNRVMGNLLTQLKQDGPDGEPLDIRIAIGDFNGFYGSEHSQSGTPYDRDANDKTSDAYYTANSYARIFTGDKTLGTGAFQDVHTYNWTDLTINDLHSGTNYDYAMDAIYQMGAAIKAENQANGENRDLFVIFMSDGAAMQWNYYHSQGASETWEHWITGAEPLSYWETDGNMVCNDHLYYFNEQDTNNDGFLNEHRMANAIKGSEEEMFEVIRKSTAGISNITASPSGQDNMYMVPGLGVRAMWAISFDATTDTKVEADHMIQSIATLASHPRYAPNVASAQELGRTFVAIGNEITYVAENAYFEDQMGDAYRLQLAQHSYLPYGATDASNTEVVNPTIEVLTYDIWSQANYDSGKLEDANMIGTRTGDYDINEVVVFSADGTKAYSTAVDMDYDGIAGATRNSDGSYTITDEDDNILPSETYTSEYGTEYVAGVIYASYFVYNTNSEPVTVTFNYETVTVPAESFYWYLGAVTTQEQALRYYVYLDGSMEGQREAGSYPTNHHATLYYDNYLDNPCHQETASPVMAWQGANVSYAFYLVNEQGEVIVNQTTGQTGTFANKIAVTSPVVYQEIFLNNLDNVTAIEVASSGVLPEGYELYDPASVYTVTINSNATGKWAIEQGDGKVNSTYVTQYLVGNAAAYSNELTPPDTENDYTHTVVWFGVLWKAQALPDTVVIDYGLPVEIHVLTNDMFGENGKLVAVGEYNATFENVTAGTTLGHNGVEQVWTNPAESDSIDAVSVDYVTSRAKYYPAKYGKAAITSAGTVIYQLNGMTMDASEKLTYAVNYTGKDAAGNPLANQGYYYDTVTIIPATTIYYEDSFLTFEGYNINDLPDGMYGDTANDTPNDGLWETVGQTIAGVQDEDRPGNYSLPQVDGNNIYGSDGAYANMTTYSMGSARKIRVTEDQTYGNVKFTFTGTGCDIISLTSKATGTITMMVTEQGNPSNEHYYTVDTYYGYTYDAENDEWTVVSEDNNALYQVPILKTEALPHGTYDVVISVSYYDMFHHKQDGKLETEDGNYYDFYMDAVRIYDPAEDGKNDEDVKNAYVADNEGWPEYHELRNLVIQAADLENPDSEIEGVAFIDGKGDISSIADYVSYGPNNELYLNPGEAVAFYLDLSKYITTVYSDTSTVKQSIVADIQLGVKSANGKSVTAELSNLDGNNAQFNKGTLVLKNSNVLNTSTDMYYSISNWNIVKSDNATYPIIIQNIGEGIMSITNVKLTFSEDPTLFTPTRTAGTFALKAPSLMVQNVEEPAAPENDPVETAMPEARFYITGKTAQAVVNALNSVEPEPPTVPDETKPEETQPETTEPEESTPDETKPEETEPEETEPAPESFTPETFRMSTNKFLLRKSGNVKVTVTTSDDVDHVEINGHKVTAYTVNKWGDRTWTLNLRVESVGLISFSAVAYNAENAASKSISRTVVVLP